ncbi:MAG: TolC family protein [Sulfuricella sp.]|nr:TolC family protein [Sulfuricella sp.]
MNNSFAPWLLASFLAAQALTTLPAFADVPQTTPGATLQSLLDAARLNNPEIAAARLEAQAADERIQPAGALPDPILRTELRDLNNQRESNPSLFPGRVGSTKYTLIQAVPFWGKRDLKREVAEADAAQAKGRADGAWTELATRIKTTYAAYYLQTQATALTREILDLTASLEKITQARYSGGLVPQQDVIRAQVEQTALRSELVAQENDRHHAMVKLNALVKRPPQADLADPRQLSPLPVGFDQIALENQLRTRNPQLAGDDARIAAASKSRELVQRNRYPDFNLGISPIQRGNGISEWELMIEMNIPFQQESRRSQEREAQALLAAAEARKESTLNQLMSALSENLSALETAQRTEALTRNELLPQAELTYKAALAGYETGKVDFATLLEAQRQIRKAKLDIVKSQVDARVRLAEIERLLGEDL